MKKKMTIWFSDPNDFSYWWEHIGIPEYLYKGWDVVHPVKAKFNWRHLQWESVFKMEAMNYGTSD